MSEDVRLTMGKTTSTDLKDHLIAKAKDSTAPLSIEERAFYALLTLPSRAQAQCTERELSELADTVIQAMRAAVSHANQETAA